MAPKSGGTWQRIRALGAGGNPTFQIVGDRYFWSSNPPQDGQYVQPDDTRLDIQTAPVREAQINGAQRKVIPYAAILYDTQGATWTYISPGPLIYLRHPIKVDFIQGNDAILTDDLPAGTAVVIIGAAELYGSETEFAEE